MMLDINNCIINTIIIIVLHTNYSIVIKVLSRSNSKNIFSNNII